MFNQLSRDIHDPGATRKLSDLLSELQVVQIYGPVDAPIAGLTTDSRKVNASWLFVALVGDHTDGHNFIQQAIEKGASTIVIQRAQYEEYLSHLLSPSYAQHTQTTVVVVEDTRLAIAELAAAYYGSPAEKMRMIGITGTNGKTTTAFYIRKVCEYLGMKAGMLGTIEYSIAGERTPASLTTPMADEIHAMLADMVEAECVVSIMEVSSHALALNRVHGISFDLALYTNLSRDHLDFHGSFEEYANAKALLFKRHSKGAKVLNSDDQYQLVMWEDHDDQTLTYGVKGTPDVHIRNVELQVTGTKVQLVYNNKEYTINTALVGSFSAWNTAAAFAACVSMGLEPEDIVKGIESLEAVPGRLERVEGKNGVHGFVDYSHTPDSLEKSLKSLVEINNGNGRIITVFGCGGDRDKGKRPLMGSVASAHSDYIIITNDNPRTENPQEIIDGIVRGITDTENVTIIPDRKEAIREAVAKASNGDIILVAGKGHETYQIVGDERLHFSDVETLDEMFSTDTLQGGAH